VATGVLAFEGEGSVIFYEGNYTNYRERKEQNRVAAAAQRAEKKDTPASRPEKVKKGLSYAERIELEKLEANIGVLEQEFAGVEKQLADPSCYAAVDGGIAGISAAYSRLEGELAASYARWEELELKKGG